MNQYINKIKSYIILHKIISSIVLVVVLFAGYNLYQKLTSTTGETNYILSKVSKGTIVSSITGSGQVSALNQINITPNVSGTITYINTKPGNNVSSGQTLFIIDDASAKKTIRDAEISLTSSKISLEQLKIQKSQENMNADLAKAYDDGFNTVSNAFLDLPGIITGLNNIFFKASPSTGQWGIDYYEAQTALADRDQVKILKNNLSTSYNQARTSYDASFSNYKTISRNSDKAILESLITQTYDTTILISDVIKNANNYLDFINDSITKQNFNTPPILNSDKTTLSGYTSKANSHLGNLLSTKTNLKTYKDAFQNSDLDIQSSQLSVTQKENVLQDAKDKLADYYVRAPFSGTISSVPIQKGDNASSGTTLATLITSQQIATIALNEVDIAKVQLGQKVTLTFDAISDLTISGKVAQIDSIGTVSQGVVNYNVKISFDTNDSSVKPGMSVSAAIITNIKQDILLVPNSAIKNQGGTSYVEMFDTPLETPITGAQGSPSLIPPRQQMVVIGLSNDTSTEIVSGLKEGDEIISKTILPSTASTTSTAPSILNSATNRSGGGTVRIPNTTGR